MKKSYLSKQAIAAIVILTVIAILVPVYIFVLKPLFQKEETPEAGQDVYEPIVEGEEALGVSSLVGKTQGGSVALYTADLPADVQSFEIHTSTEDWGFKYYVDNGFVINEYESMVVSESIINLYMSICHPVGTHIAPSSDELIALQKEKAEKMPQSDLDAAGGWNQIPLTAEDIFSIEVNFEEYGLGDLASADCISYTDKDGKTVKLYLGNYTLDGQERYARMEGRNIVYKIESARTAYFGYKVLDLIPPVVFDVTEGAATGDYMMDQFIIFRDGEARVKIKKFSDKEVLAMDRLTRSLVVESYETEDGQTFNNFYDTSSEYTLIMYRYFMSEIRGTAVVYAPKSEVTQTESGDEVYIHGDVPDETLLVYGIDPDKPHLTLDTVKFTDSTKTQYLENILIFSEPFEENGTKYYNVYNLLRGIIVRMPVSFMPFMEESDDYFMSKYISTLSINDLDTISFDATSLPEWFSYKGVQNFKESFTLNYQMDGDKRATTSSGLEIIEKVTLSSGAQAPAVPGGDNSVENFRHLYYHLGKVMMYANNLKDFMDEIEKVDRTKPGLTITYSVYGTDRSHTMNFYFFDETGYWAFYTIDGDGRYIVKTDDIRLILIGVQAVRDGESVTALVGPIG